MNRIRRMFWIMVLAGVAALIAALSGMAAERTWISYLVNFCFWSGMAQAGIIFSASYRLTNGRWGETIRRVAEGFVLFIPLSVLLFLVTYLGRTTLWPWIAEPIEAKAAWLNEPFFFLRVTAYYLILSVLSLWYVAISIRPDLGALKAQNPALNSRLVDRLTQGWKGQETEQQTRDARLRVFAPVMLVVSGLVYTFIGFDVVMSLDPHWYSSLYGWLYLVHAFNAGVAGTMVVAILARRHFQMRATVSTAQFYDLSRLLMGISMLAGGFYWGQFITIWYGNLGEEIERLILRFDHAPWPLFQWAVIFFLYFFPLLIFLSRSIKEKPRALIVIATVILAANWLYQFVEIAPSVWHGQSVPLGIPEFAVTLGFLGAFALCWIAYAKRVPLTSQTEQ